MFHTDSFSPFSDRLRDRRLTVAPDRRRSHRTRTHRLCVARLAARLG